MIFKSRTIHKKGTRIVGFILAIVLFLSFGACKKDPDDFPRQLTNYLYLCPAGKTACYQDCQTGRDTNGNGVIDDLEMPSYLNCTDGCDNRCDDSFILLYFLNGNG